MRIILLLILALMVRYSHAQITLGSSDFPDAGDIYLMSDATAFPGMDETLTGANYTWDYAQLSSTTTGQHTDTLFSVTNMNIIYQAVFGDFGFLPNRSNQATHGIDFSLGAITITNVYNFFYNNSADYHQSGFGAEINGIPLPTAYSPHDILYKFPIQYGNADSSLSGYSVSLPGLIYYEINRNRKNEVDGWGTLTTPNGTFNALRIKTTVLEHDSVYIDSLGFGFGFNVPARTEYKWLGQGGGLPLLQITVVGGNVISIIYKGINTSGITAIPQNNFDFVLFPNPAAEKIIARFTLPKSEDVDFTVTNLEGKIITTANKRRQPSGDHVMILDLPADIASGNYLVKMTCGNQSISKPVSVVR